MRCWQKALILAAISASLALADDFRTINGKEYKDVKVSRVEPDGIVLITKTGISKVYFIELPKDVQERFHYDSAKAAQFNAAEQAAAAHSNAAAAQQQQQQQALAELARAQKYRIQGRVQRNANGGLIVELGNFGGGVSHNATDIPMGIKNPISDATWSHKVVFLRGHPEENNLVDNDEVDVVAYDSGTASLGGSTYRCYTFYSR
jgi:hypothetical protein